jgi:hypothetical protein
MSKYEAIKIKINPLDPRSGLVVEGKEDKEFFELQLDAHIADKRLKNPATPDWRTKWVVGDAGGKPRVLEILDSEKTWHGIVDADEWDSATLLAHQTKYGNRLHILPRYCMESYFILPHEVWNLLTPARQNQVSGGLTAFDAAIKANLAQWVRHGALWRIVNPLWHGLRAKGFNNILLDLANAQDNTLIQATFTNWHQYMDPNQLFQDFQTQLQAANALSQDDQLKEIVHGKMFFEQQLVPELNRLFGQKPKKDWLSELTKNCPAHPDFIPFWTSMGI